MLVLIILFDAVFVILLYKHVDMKLFVAAIPYDFDDVDLKEMFELYGEVNSAKVILDKETGKSRGFGFVDMLDDNVCEASRRATQNRWRLW